MIHIDTVSRMVYDMVVVLHLNPVSGTKRGFFVFTNVYEWRIDRTWRGVL